MNNLASLPKGKKQYNVKSFEDDEDSNLGMINWFNIASTLKA